MAKISFYSVDDHSNQAVEFFKKQLPEHSIHPWPHINCKPEELDYAICWQPPENFFDGATNLKSVLSMAAGVDHLLQHPGLPAKVPLIRLCDAGMGQKIAEYVHFGVLRAHRNFDLYRTQQDRREWRAQPDIDAGNYHVGVMGFGVIGQVVAKHLYSAGYHVSAWKRSPVTESYPFEIFTRDRKAFLDNLDVLVCVLPLTDETRNMIDADLLSALPAGAHFINVGRGSQVVESDLLHALDKNHLRSALLDVCVEEPLPADHKLWMHPNVTLTPHVAGPTQLQLSVDQIVQSIQAIESGQAPELLAGAVNNTAGY